MIANRIMGSHLQNNESVCLAISEGGYNNDQ